MATRIKDGIFVADGESSQDGEFMEMSKISYVINCAGRQLPNMWAQHGIRYLTFSWEDDPSYRLFDGHDTGRCVVAEQICAFIDEALIAGESVLIHSLRGTGRAVACALAYLMHKYEWGLDKALAFIRGKRADAAPNPGFLKQLASLDRRLQRMRMRKIERLPQKRRRKALEDAQTRLNEWDAAAPRIQAFDTIVDRDAEELVQDEEELVNSFFNAQSHVDVAKLRSAAHEMAHAATRLRWVDNRDAGMRGVVSGPSGSGRGPDLRAPAPRRGILKGVLKQPAQRPAVVDPYADDVDPYQTLDRGFASPLASPQYTGDPDDRLKAIVRDVELSGSPPRRHARKQPPPKPSYSKRATFGITLPAEDPRALPPPKRPTSASRERRRKTRQPQNPALTPTKARPGTPAARSTTNRRRAVPPGPAGPAPVFSGAIASGLRRQKRRQKQPEMDPLALTYSAPRSSVRRPTSAPARPRRPAPARGGGGLFPATLLAGFEDLMVRGAMDDSWGRPKADMHHAYAPPPARVGRVRRSRPSSTF